MPRKPKKKHERVLWLICKRKLIREMANVLFRESDEINAELRRLQNRKKR